MDIGEFIGSIAVSAAAITAAVLFSAGGGISIPFALCLLALSQAGYFALLEFRKSQVGSPSSEYLFFALVLFAFALASLSTLALGAAASVLFIPIVFSAPAVYSFVRSQAGIG